MLNVVRRDERNRLEPTEKVCSNCGELKQSGDYRPVPIGGRAHICNQCVSERSKEKDRRTVASDETIQSELWKQYDKAHSTSEKIRCLEALVKLRPSDRQSSLDEPAVVASLMKSLKAKKNDATDSE
jgi:hypothetical protein